MLTYRGWMSEPLLRRDKDKLWGFILGKGDEVELPSTSGTIYRHQRPLIMIHTVKTSYFYHTSLLSYQYPKIDESDGKNLTGTYSRHYLTASRHGCGP